LVASHVHSKTFQHARKSIFGKRCIAHGVARAIQTDDNAVSDEIILANALHIDNITNAGLARRWPWCGHERGQKQYE
jgi:hypothetical protein